MNEKISVSAGFALLFAALWFLDNSGSMSAVIPTVIIHELGHAAALMAFGTGISRITVDISGFCMDYIYPPGRAGEIFAAAAGPLAGIIYAVACSLLGKIFDSEYLLCTAGVSLVLSLFNLMPASPMDGGRIMSMILSEWLEDMHVERIELTADAVVSAGFIFAGFLLFMKGYGAALIPTGIWIISHRISLYCKNQNYGIE